MCGRLLFSFYSMAFTLKQRKQLASSLAIIENIGAYRKMLSDRHSPAASTVIIDKGRLAFNLAYFLLEYYSPDEILAVASQSTVTQSTAKECRTAVPDTQTVKEERKRLTKFDEYPHIDWRNLDEPDVRTADLLYSDRINTYNDLKGLEKELGDNECAPSVLLGKIVQKSIRHELCISELVNFDRRGKFIGKHPLIGEETEADRVRKLLRENPEEFLQEYANVRQNIARYSSFLKSKSRSDEQKARDQVSLNKYNALADTYFTILKQNTI